MWQHSHTLVKDNTKVFYGIIWFGDLGPDRHGRGFWCLTIFGAENYKFSFIAVQFELVQSHPVLNVHYAGFDSLNSLVLVNFIAIAECRVELAIICIKVE